MVITTAPPQVLTMDEYEKDWKPQGWQLIVIGPTSTWRQDWGEWQAIRDIVQNALDETENYSWGYDTEGLYIRDVGKGVAVADFLLGPPKLKPDYARGKFGEGMKIAALALVRLGYSVRVETVGRELWIIFLEQKVNGTAETLAALWKPNGRRMGTIFHIVGYTGTAFEDRFAVNLPKRSIIAEGPSLLHEPIRRFNQLIEHEFVVSPPSGWYEKGAGASRVYARDIYMQDISSPYSYNLWSFDMAPDRHAPKEEYRLWADIGRLWACVTKVEHLQVFLQMVKNPPLLETDESRRIDMGDWTMGTEPATGKSYADFVKENASSWQIAWRNVMHPDPLEPPAVIRTDPKWDGMVKHLNYKSVSLLASTRDTLSRAITTDVALCKASQERLREVEIVPDERLDPIPRAHMKLAREITKRVFPFSPPAGVYAAIIPPASDRVRTAGLYSLTTSEVYIDMVQMPRLHNVIDTLVHELAHHRQFKRTGEADDLTPSHMEAMQYIAANVVKIAAQSEIGHLFKEVTW
jgi:hypothetical protein